MVQIDIPWSLLIGSTLAEAGQVQLRKEPEPVKSPCFLAGMAFLALLFNPSGMYLLWRYPQWETLYWLRGAPVPDLLPAIFLAVLSAVYALGFVWGARQARNGTVNRLVIFNRTLTWSIVGFLALNYRRFLFLGTYQDLLGRWTPNMPAATLGRDLWIMAGLLAPGYLWVYRYFWYGGKKIAANGSGTLTPAENRSQLLAAVGIGEGVVAAGVVFVLVVRHFLQ